MPHLSEASSRPAVILLHASASSARQWDRLAETLSSHWDVRAIELHGHRRQAPWRGERALTLADEAALVAPVLARAGPAHVVGHSYGAAVGLKLATLYSRSVLSVTAYEPVLFGWLREGDANADVAGEVVTIAAAIRHHLARGEPQAAAERFVDFWSGPGTWLAMPLARREPIASRMPAVASHFAALFAEPMRPADLARLALPMLFLSGGRTVAPMRRLAAMSMRMLPNARHAILPGLDHMGPLGHPSEVNARIIALLGEQERCAASGTRLQAVA